MKSSAFLTASSLCIMVNAMPVDPNGNLSGLQGGNPFGAVIPSMGGQHPNQNPMGGQSGSGPSKEDRKRQKKEEKRRRKEERKRRKEERKHSGDRRQHNNVQG
ncbi:hypothetical protein MT418_006218 [Batrachochytrium dendrobatidis]